uniref:Uncharacterized protein n=1 Tax=Oryza sativa subsp. japonica TaxID=39947 RepID=Q5Z7P4_ORYSJ|nr:hypothetical protein [Oryza sativa Japonica Group]
MMDRAIVLNFQPPAHFISARQPMGKRRPTIPTMVGTDNSTLESEVMMGRFRRVYEKINMALDWMLYDLSSLTLFSNSSPSTYPPPSLPFLLPFPASLPFPSGGPAGGRAACYGGRRRPAGRRPAGSCPAEGGGASGGGAAAAAGGGATPGDRRPVGPRLSFVATGGGSGILFFFNL